MQKNVSGQKWTVFAFGGQGHATPGDPITGDAANITANLRIDGGTANAVDDTNPTETEGGYYVFDISQAECNGDHISIHPSSGTSDVLVIGCPAALYTTPASFPDLNINAAGGTVEITDNTPRPNTGTRQNFNPSQVGERR